MMGVWDKRDVADERCHNKQTNILFAKSGHRNFPGFLLECPVFFFLFGPILLTSGDITLEYRFSGS
jgi:hypothetical protein